MTFGGVIEVDLLFTLCILFTSSLASNGTGLGNAMLREFDHKHFEASL